MDRWAAVTILRQVLADVEDCLPLPRDINDPAEDEDED